MGVLRAAVDSVADHHAVAFNFDRARLEGAVELHVQEIAALLRRTAEAAARGADPAQF